jgi:hypothetical protein
VGSSRTCGARCHQAKQPGCDCWCKGLFHGEAGRAAREAFAREFGGEGVPALEDPENLFWARAMAAAEAARAPNPCKPSELVVSGGSAAYTPCAHCGVVHRPRLRIVPTRKVLTE